MQSKSENLSPGILAIIDQCPPFMIYYLSHHGRGRRMTIEELVKDSGLSYRTFTRTARTTSWSSVRLHVMDRFCRACGLSPFESERVILLLKQEFSSPKPFSAMEHNMRSPMLANFNKLCMRAALQNQNGNIVR